MFSRYISINCKLGYLISGFDATFCWKFWFCVTDHKQTSHRLAYIECHSDSDSHAWPTLSHSSLIVWDMSHIPIDWHTLRVTHPTLPYKEMCECFAWLVDAWPYLSKPEKVLTSVLLQLFIGKLKNLCTIERIFKNE